MSGHMVVTASHAQPDYKVPWMLFDKEFYQSEMARLLVSDTIKLDPIDYDLYKGGLRYYHGEISRDEAIARLSQRKEDGVFLLRVGSNGAHVISVICKGEPIHIEIKAGRRGGVCLGQHAPKEYPDIAQMILACVGQKIQGFDVSFMIPIPPSTRNLYDPSKGHVARKDSTSSMSSLDKSPGPKERREKKKKKTKKLNVPQRPPVVLADMQVGEIRFLLEQHGIDYRDATNRTQLEALATGLEWPDLERSRSVGSRARSVSPGSGEPDPLAALRPPGNAMSAKSSLSLPAGSTLGRRKSTGAMAAKPTADGGSGGGLSLFQQYKQRSVGADLHAPSSATLAAPPPTRARAQSAGSAAKRPSQTTPANRSRALRDDSRATDTGDTTSGAAGTDNTGNADGDDDDADSPHRLSVMATAFFSNLFAEAAAETSDTDADTETPAGLPQVHEGDESEAPPCHTPDATPTPRPASPPKPPVVGDPNATSSEDSDSESDASDDEDGNDGAASASAAGPAAGGDSRAAFHANVADTATAPSDADKAAERAARRRQKLLALAGGV
eukprot:m.419374 g.419374  ORF g.419374 m.419374 type:complete len:556 (+) comp21304_c1_seq1:483-2150(+)